MSDHNPIQVLSVQGDSESRRALAEFFSGIPDLNIAAEASDAISALQQLQEKSIDVALIDVGLPDIDGIGLTKEIRQSRPGVRVLILTESDDPEDIFAAMDAGADGYVLKGNLTRALETALRSVRLGAVWLDPLIASQVLQATVTAASERTSRTLPTGILCVPLMPEEKSVLTAVAESDCTDGVCLVDPAFLRKLRRFAPTSE